jgi:hypothetical protein
MATTYDFYSDTHPEAFEFWIGLLRKKTPGEKLGMVFEMVDTMLRVQEDQVRRKYPQANHREVFLRAAAFRLDRETMIRAYGWDPESGQTP